MGQPALCGGICPTCEDGPPWLSKGSHNKFVRQGFCSSDFNQVTAVSEYSSAKMENDGVVQQVWSYFDSHHFAIGRQLKRNDKRASKLQTIIINQDNMLFKVI